MGYKEREKKERGTFRPMNFNNEFSNQFRERTMHKVTCSDCGAETEVPFEPKPGRPVYCRECYRKKKAF